MTCLTSHTGKRVRSVLLKFFLVCALFPATFAGRETMVFAANLNITGVIQVSELNIRSGPGRHNPPIGTLKKGLRVKIQAYEGEWIKIVHSGRTGFILNRKHLIKIEAPMESDVSETRPEEGEKVSENETMGARLEDTREKIKAFTEKEAAIINQLEETDRALDRARRTVAMARSEIKSLKIKIQKAQSEYDELEKKTLINEKYAHVRLVALYKMGRLGKLQVLASAESMFDFFRQKTIIEYILEDDEKVLEALRIDRESLQNLLGTLVNSKNEKMKMETVLTDQIALMGQEQKKRGAFLKDIQSKKSLQLAAISAGKSSARNLDRTVSSFKAPQNRPAVLEDAVPMKPFSELKGLLMIPVKGKIVSFFGHYRDRKLDIVNFRSGINIKADRGEPIRAVSDGVALYSSWFKGYGNMIIIDHGDHYYTVYAHIEEVFKNKGDRVETGEVIATVGDSGSMTGAGLHFEVRHHGKPMDPRKWIKKG